MKASFFSSLLIALMLTLTLKGFIVFNKVQKETNNAINTSASSILVDSAYAKEELEVSRPLAKNTNIDTQAVQKENNPQLEKLSNESEQNSNVTVNSQVSIGNLNTEEIKLLKELSKRRQALDKTQDDLVVREQVLKATEGKIEQKISELKNLQSQVEEGIKQHKEKENQKIQSLVRIYENMKPRDAAKIFDELDMTILLQIVSNMKELKVAPVIASMNPAKARELSIELAKQKTFSLE